MLRGDDADAKVAIAVSSNTEVPGDEKLARAPDPSPVESQASSFWNSHRLKLTDTRGS